MTHYEVQTYTLCDGWINCWSDGEGTPTTYQTREAAKIDLDEFFQDIKDAVACGDMEEEYDPEEYRIVEVQS